MYSYGPPHMADQKQDDLLEYTYSSYVRIRDVALKTCQRRLTIGRSGERGSEISVLAARHDDDDDIYIYIIIYMCVCVCVCVYGISLNTPTWHHGYNTQPGVLTPHMTSCLQRPKKFENTTPSSFFKKVSDDEVFTSKLIRLDLLFCFAIAF